jgi:ParB/RepB/Spo0J family partition protein
MREVVEVPLSQIDPPLIPMREQFGDAPFQELCEDIARNGVKVPIRLRRVGERFRISFGHRRTEAAKVCGLQTIPAEVVDMTDAEEVRDMIAENTGREDVSDAEKGRHYLGLMEHFKLNLEQVAAMVGKTVPYVDERVSMVQCDSDIADANRDGHINFWVCKELLRVNPYTWARAMRCAVDLCDEPTRAKIEAHRKFLLDLCIRCGATGKVARGYVEQWKNSLVPVLPYEPKLNADAVAPPAVAMSPRCIACGRDSDPGNMVDIKVHHWERDRILKILRDSGMEVYA